MYQAVARLANEGHTQSLEDLTRLIELVGHRPELAHMWVQHPALSEGLRPLIIDIISRKWYGRVAGAGLEGSVVLSWALEGIEVKQARELVLGRES